MTTAVAPSTGLTTWNLDPAHSKVAFKVKHLTICGVTKEVALDVTDEGRGRDPWGGTRAGFTITGKINRADFGLTWNAALETGGVVVSDEVKLEAEVEFVKA